MNSRALLEKDDSQYMVNVFWQSIPPVWQKTRSLLHQVAVEEFKISVSHFHILRRLKDGSGSVSELSDCMHLSRSNISRSVNELVQLGYVKREPDRIDRRNINLTLTDEGEVVITKMLDAIEFRLKEKFDCLASDEKDEVARGLALLLKVFLGREII